MEYIDIITEVPFDQESDEQIAAVESEQMVNVRSSFIEANTLASSLSDIKKNHIIPVYNRDNETLISQTEFIETMMDVVHSVYCSERIMQPIVRVSHPLKGRIAEARNKPANELLEHERTLFYERMAFIIEIPSIQSDISGNTLSLTVGGVKNYGQDNLYNKKGADEHFKIFIGFKNTVCTNMCVWSDGYVGNLKVSSIGQLAACINTMINSFNAGYQLYQMEQLTKYALTEQQFATVIGKCRMYQHLPYDLRKDIPTLLLSDTQISSVCKDFYKDQSFCRDVNGDINLWRFYNLLTGANKSSYIDSFLDRAVNAFSLAEQIRYGLERKSDCWYLS